MSRPPGASSNALDGWKRRRQMMRQTEVAFVGMFTTLLAIINPLEALPVFLKLLEGKSDEEHRRIARRSCLYARS